MTEPMVRVVAARCETCGPLPDPSPVALATVWVVAFLRDRDIVHDETPSGGEFCGGRVLIATEPIESEQGGER